MPPRFNAILRTALLGSRWGMAPFCLGLVAALLIVIAQFCRELVHAVADFPTTSDADIILAVLRLVDLVLLGNLVVMLISGGVEIFLPTAAHQREAEAGERDIVDIAALKPRFFASISAIAAIDLLESFINIGQADKGAVLWQVAILLAFVVSGVLLAWMERLGSARR